MISQHISVSLLLLIAGEGSVMRAGNRIPDFKETQACVKKVLSVYRVLQLR